MYWGFLKKMKIKYQSRESMKWRYIYVYEFSKRLLNDFEEKRQNIAIFISFFFLEREIFFWVFSFLAWKSRNSEKLKGGIRIKAKDTVITWEKRRLKWRYRQSECVTWWPIIEIASWWNGRSVNVDGVCF